MEEINHETLEEEEEEGLRWVGGRHGPKGGGGMISVDALEKNYEMTHHNVKVTENTRLAEHFCETPLS